MTKETINHYMQFVSSIEKMGGTRTRYHVGDNFIVDITTCSPDLRDRHCIMNLWKKAGFIPAALPSYLVVETYFTDVGGLCWGWYNVTEKSSEDGLRHVINFDYLREATPENERELVAECIRMRELDIRPLCRQ